MSAAVLYPGLPVRIGGQELIMPPLNAKTARKYWERIAALQRGEETDPLGLVAAVTHACLQRNYPQLELEQVEDAIDLDNFDGFLARASGQGAFRKWAEAQAAQAAAAGNATSQPTEPAAAGTGAASTPASPPPPAGVLPTSTS